MAAILHPLSPSLYCAIYEPTEASDFLQTAVTQNRKCVTMIGILQNYKKLGELYNRNYTNMLCFINPLTLYFPSDTLVTKNFLLQVHLDTCRCICNKDREL